MKKVEIKDLSENFFETIGKEWMLVTVGTKEQFNTMTASWGGIGWLWNKPVVFVFVRPERYTFEFTEKKDSFTLAFLGKEHRNIYNFCGSHSGRDSDKVKATGLKPLFTESGNVTFEQAHLTLECKKLYAEHLSPDGFFDSSLIEKWYNEHGGMHKMYVAEIVSAFGK